MKFFLTVFFLLNSLLLGIESSPIRSPEEGDLYQGDILGVVKDEKGTYVNPYKYSERWPNGEVPYFIDPEARYSYSELRAIEDGLNHIEDVTKLDNKQVVRFIKFDDEQSMLMGGFFGGIRVIRGNGCYSYLGKRTDMIFQNVSIGTGCTNVGNVAHEFMHALGFDHEQARPDRDGFVTVYYENIQFGNEHNFDKYTVPNSQGITIGLMEFPYDYGSIMHYGEYFFSKNGEPTIKPRKSGVYIGQREGLSYQDALEINAAYEAKSIEELLALLEQATTTKKTTTHQTTKVDTTTNRNVNSGSIRLFTSPFFHIISFFIITLFYI